MIPPPESGVLQVSGSGANGALGSDILGAGIPNPYYEIGMPADKVHAADPVGVMLEIHGGGWVEVGPGAVRTMRPDADFWRSHGWETVDIDYRGCSQSVGDVIAFYRRVRQLVGSNAVICANGQSAGGSLALMLAAKEGPNGISCVITEAAITDIGALGSQHAYPSGHSGFSAQRLEQDLLAAFGASDAAQLSAYSPISYASSYNTPTLLGTAINDVVLPVRQAVSFSEAVLASNPSAYIDVYELPCPSLGIVALCQDTILARGQEPRSIRNREHGLVIFAHGTTSGAGLSVFRQRELTLADYALSATH